MDATRLLLVLAILAGAAWLFFKITGMVMKLTIAAVALVVIIAIVMFMRS